MLGYRPECPVVGTVLRRRFTELAEIDLNKLSMGDKVIGVSGIALIIFSFFKWLGVKVEVKGIVSASDAKGAWTFTLTMIAVLIGIAMVAYVVLKLLDVKLPELGGVTWGQVLLALGAIAFAFVLIKLIVGPSGVSTSGLAGYSVTKTRKIGIFLGPIASAGLAYGGYLKFKEERPPPPT